jgi:elongator complex protein 3
MPGLPYSNYKKDIESFKKIFDDSNFRPDQLKIYPCQIVEDSPLSKIYKKIKYKPMSNLEIKKILVEMMKIIPYYCRVMRVMREIPKEKMLEDAASTSVRGDVHNELKNDGGIKEIRMREVGFQEGNVKLDTKLNVSKYDASNGIEYFLEIINSDDILFGLLRLRLTNDAFIPELKDCAIVRELHVYGQALKLGEKGEKSQHLGMGKKLLIEAQRIAKENNYKKIAIISGVGVREYYKKLGYQLHKNYMIKDLS